MWFLISSSQQQILVHSEFSRQRNREVNFGILVVHIWRKQHHTLRPKPALVKGNFSLKIPIVSSTLGQI
jgi:hypothetical protein